MKSPMMIPAGIPSYLQHGRETKTAAWCEGKTYKRDQPRTSPKKTGRVRTDLQWGIVSKGVERRQSKGDARSNDRRREKEREIREGKERKTDKEKEKERGGGRGESGRERNGDGAASSQPRPLPSPLGGQPSQHSVGLYAHSVGLYALQGGKGLGGGEGPEVDCWWCDCW